MIRLKKVDFLKRAAVCAALFFQAGSQASTETYRDLIQKAYNLSLQKDRAQSMAILLGALKREGKKSAAQKELASALEQVAKVFYSDKTQQLYELAISLRFSDSATASTKLQEAARLEPDNLTIEMALARQLMASGDCDAAAKRLVKHKDLVGAIEEFRLLSAQIHVCLGKFQDYVAMKSGHDVKQSPYSLFWQNLESEHHFKTGAFQKALESSQAAQKIDSGFPEPFYWRWKTEIELKQKPSNAAQRYLNLCKTLNSRQQREYLAEAMLCRRTAEIENFIKKTNNSEI